LAEGRQGSIAEKVSENILEGLSPLSLIGTSPTVIGQAANKTFVQLIRVQHGVRRFRRRAGICCHWRL
jgi:hypothetical protein